jgi:hypothetical protein
MFWKVQVAILCVLVSTWAKRPEQEAGLFMGREL